MQKINLKKINLQLYSMTVLLFQIFLKKPMNTL